MKKRRRIEGEIELPEALIQHIQSFLRGKEAARTTILSKSWYNAWLTRPNLVFDHRDFWDYEFKTNSKKFSKFSKKTLQRYQDLNLKIDSFEFRMPFRGCRYSVANELTVEAIKMGATDISFETYQALKFALPGEVLQSESLIRLSVTCCTMESVKVNCSKLKYLYLCEVLLEGDLFWDISSSCPLIEGLELRECKCVLDISKGFELHKLKTLLLEKVRICSWFFDDFSSRFPCLKNLSVHKCSCYKKIQIYSKSLVFISFVHSRTILNAEFYVPNLRKFCFSGESSLPLVSFPNSCNWESHVSISLCHSRDDLISAKWLLNLNKLLRNLSLSKVSLNLQTSYLCNIDKARNTPCLPRPLVGNLIIAEEFSDYATLLDSLTQWCRPVFVTQNWDPRYPFINWKRRIESMVIVYRILMQQRKSVDDLEDVSVEVFDEAVSGWRTVSWKSLGDTFISRPAKQRIRFHLRWGQH